MRLLRNLDDFVAILRKEDPTIYLVIHNITVILEYYYSPVAIFTVYYFVYDVT